MIKVAALCIGVGFLLSFPSRSNIMKAQYLNRATRVKELKGLEELLEKKPLNRTVVVFGTVGSTSTVETNFTGDLGVFVEETATIFFERKNSVGPTQDYKQIVLNRKEVPWYLDDGTAQVNVMEAQYAKGFYDTLKKYVFTEPVTKHFERFLSMKDVQILQHKCCDHVLEIGTPLTIVGLAERDKNGAPTIGRAYQVFNGHVNVDELVSNLESNSKHYGKFSSFLTSTGVAIVAVHVLQHIITK